MKHGLVAMEIGKPDERGTTVGGTGFGKLGATEGFVCGGHELKEVDADPPDPMFA